MKEVKRELVAIAVFLVFGMVLNFWLIPTQVQVATWNTGGVYTSQTFPYLLAKGMMLLSIVGAVSKLYSIKKIKKEEKEMMGNEGGIRVLIYPALISVLSIIYFILLDKTGFIVSTIVFIISMNLLLREKKRQIAYLLLFSLAIYLVFTYILHINLP